jgi:hypothetical protein
MPQLIVMQQAMLRYYGNAIWCIDHVTKENLICHIMFIYAHIDLHNNFKYLLKTKLKL